MEVKTELRTGNEHFTFNGFPVNKLLSDFWAWNSSDLLNNTMRGALAEFIVASALEIDVSKPREDWTVYDLLWNNVRIEVKCSAYLQSWNKDGERLSRIVFSIAPAYSWSAEKGYGDDLMRHSDVYVFCLYSCKDRKLADPLRLEQWRFYIVPTKQINETLGTQKSLSLPALERMAPVSCDFYGIEHEIKRALCL